MPAAGALGAAAKTESYVYGNMNWKDKVTSVDGKEITYDAIGNPLNYDHNGVRAEKGVNNVIKSCTLSGKNIVHMAQGDLVAMIDADGKQVVECYYDVSSVLLSKRGSMVSALGIPKGFAVKMCNI